jgi:hypothetical protein
MMVIIGFISILCARILISTKGKRILHCVYIYGFIYNLEPGWRAREEKGVEGRDGRKRENHAAYSSMIMHW